MNTSTAIHESIADPPSVAVRLPAGDTARIALQGAQLLSWQTADGRERLYLSPQAIFDGRSAIRGGVPVCFPQFNQRVIDGRLLPKHGFARGLPWRVVDQACGAQAASLRLQLDHRALPEALRARWPYDFDSTLSVDLSRSQLRIGFETRNTGREPWPFALALHSYLRVDDIGRVRLDGLHQVRYWDAVRHLDDPQRTQLQPEPSLRFGPQTDRVYQRVPARLKLSEPGRSLLIEQSSEFTETVVWNPGPELSAHLADLPDDGFRQMLCVEAARIDQPVVLSPGQRWAGWQQFTAVAGS